MDVLKYINDKVNEFKEEDGWLYAIYGTPAESLCGLQIEQFRKMYGVIENVSDRPYVSNSFHCHVTEDITPIQKQDLEGRFWDLCNGGKIQYVRYPIDYNKDAIRTLVRRAMDKGFYEGVNLSLAYCDDCGHQELEMDVCPVCGSTNLTKIDRMNGYLSYSRVHGDTRLNSAKQKRADRRIEDYFEHVANLNQDMAVEIIFQCGDKEFWEEHTDKKEKMYNVYAYLLSTMERFLPNFKVANAVIHFDEASPHMHVVGVPVWEGAKKGLAKKVSKRNVFTPESLSVILQDKLREEAGSCFKFNVKEELAEKKLGRNHDLSVMEYKVVKETERLEELQEQVKDSDLDLFAKKLAYKEVSKTQKEKLDEINKDISSKEAQAEELDYQITIMKSQLYEYEEEASKLEKFKESLSNLKQYIASYMPLSPLIEEYANAVEGKREIQAGNSFRGLLTALGELLNSFKELIVDGICWFPRLMRWQTSKGEVAPVFSDYRNEGYNYRLVAYQNLVTKEQYSVESVQEEIKAENRVGTLEQLERRIEETEVLVRKLHKDKMR